MRTLVITAALAAALGACSTMFGARQGTIEYPGSAAGPSAVPVYVTTDKDTVDSLAERYGVSSQTIIDRNKLRAPYSLRAGQTLEIPGARVVGPESPTRTAATAAAPPGAVKKDDLPPPASAPAAVSKPTPGEPTPLSPPPAKEVTVAATPPAHRFAWPVQGKVVSTYGSRADGQRNDGIDIAAAKGAPVKAAEAGKVVYAGNEVRGMGNLLLVSHTGGYITAYGYNDELLVKKGDTVKKGQAIAKVGTSGGSKEPALHFEVRQGNKPVDPATVLPPQ
jgi:lipoprotein NlpD